MLRPPPEPPTAHHGIGSWSEGPCPFRRGAETYLYRHDSDIFHDSNTLKETIEMKTLTATVAAFATIATLAAAPAMAESTVNQQQEKLRMILSMQKEARDTSKRPSVSAPRTVNRMISTRMLSGPEKARARLLRVQPDAATGGR